MMLLSPMQGRASREGVVGPFTVGVNGDTAIIAASSNVVRNGTFGYLETLAP